MNEKIADLILRWHGVHVALSSCIESVNVVLDQHSRATLLPDRITELRHEIMSVRETIPHLTHLMEELTGEVSWPMKPEDESPVADQDAEAIAEQAMAAPADVHALDPVVHATGDPEAEAEAAPTEEPEPPTTSSGDYDAEGATPVERVEAREEAEAAEVVPDEETSSEADATGTP